MFSDPGLISQKCMETYWKNFKVRSRLKLLNVRFLLSCIICLSLSENPVEAQKSIEEELDSLVEVAKTLDDAEEVKMYLKISRIYLDELGNEIEALLYARKAHFMARGWRALDLEAKANIRLAFAFGRTADYDSALYYGTQGLAFFEQRLEEPGTMGSTERQDFQKEMLDAFLATAVAYQLMNDYPSAISNYEKAIDKVQEMDEASLSVRAISSRYALICYNKANLFFNAGEFPKAIHSLQEAIDIDKKNEPASIKIPSNILMAAVYRELGQLDKSIALSQDLLESHGDSMDKARQIAIYTGMAKTYAKGQQLEAAIQNAEKALWIALSTDFTHHIAQSFRVLSTLHEEKGDFKQALQNFRSYMSYRVAELNKFDEREVGRIEAQYEAKATLLEDRLKYESEIERQRSRNLIISIGVIVLLVLLAVVIWNLHLLKKSRRLKEVENQKLLAEQELKSSQMKLLEQQVEKEKEIDQLKKEKLNNLLDYKRRQLTSSTISKENLNNQLRKVREKLIEIRNSPLEGDLERQIADLIKLIKPSLNSNQDWKLFQTHFESVHPRFFSELRDRGSHLTENELKHCAYVQLQLTNKEVANMHGISPGSVKMARNRIKKKLNLMAEESLSKFLSSMTSNPITV